jgi:Putative Actinobacterial Holin-X, holin superfamily III
MNQPSGFRRVVRDIADLCELQVQLLAIDGKVAAGRGGAAAVVLTIAAIFGLSAVLTCLLALASLLHEQAAWTVSSSLLAAAGVAALIGGLFALIGMSFYKKAMSAFDETRSEFAENLRWLKAAVAPETSPRAQVSENSFRSYSSSSFERGPGMNSRAGDFNN